MPAIPGCTSVAQKELSLPLAYSHRITPPTRLPHIDQVYYVPYRDEPKFDLMEGFPEFVLDLADTTDITANPTAPEPLNPSAHSPFWNMREWGSVEGGQKSQRLRQVPVTRHSLNDLVHYHPSPQAQPSPPGAWAQRESFRSHASAHTSWCESLKTRPRHATPIPGYPAEDEGKRRVAQTNFGRGE